MKKLIVLIFGILALTSCKRDSKLASDNLSYEADNFQIDRRVTFINGITDQYLLSVIGKCAIDDQGNQLEVTCKIGEGKFKKHFLGKGDNTIYVVEQLEPVGVSVYHHSIVFKPQSIIPDVDFKAGLGK